MAERRFQIQRKVLFGWVAVDDFITEERARIEARKMSGITRIVTIWREN